MANEKDMEKKRGWNFRKGRLKGCQISSKNIKGSEDSFQVRNLPNFINMKLWFMFFSSRSKSSDGRGVKNLRVETAVQSSSKTKVTSQPTTPANVMSLVLEELKSLKKQTGDIAEQLNSQVSLISNL